MSSISVTQVLSKHELPQRTPLTRVVSFIERNIWELHAPQRKSLRPMANPPPGAVARSLYLLPWSPILKLPLAISTSIRFHWA